MSRFNPGIAIIVGTIVLCICVAVFGFCREAPNPEWVEVGENRTGTLVYDRLSVVHEGKGIISVKTRHILSTEMMVVMAESLPGSPRATHYQSREKIDCRKWEYNQVEIVFRDANFNDVSTGDKNKKRGGFGFRPIPPNTFIERLASEVCLPADLEIPKGTSSDGGKRAVEKGQQGGSFISEDRRAELANLEAQNDIQGIIAYCQVWTMVEPKNAAAWHSLGTIYAIAGETGKGIVYLRKSLDLYPGDKKAWFNLGFAYMTLQETNKAAASYEKCVELDPDYADAWFDLGVVYKIAGREEKVMNAYHELKRINPAKAERFYKKVVASHKTGE